MKLHELKPAAGSKKAPKRVGRGTGSGLGRNAGKGERAGEESSGGGNLEALQGDRRDQEKLSGGAEPVGDCQYVRRQCLYCIGGNRSSGDRPAFGSLYRYR